MRIIVRVLVAAIVVQCLSLSTSNAQIKYKSFSDDKDSLRLSNKYMPEFGVQSWSEEHFFDGNYKKFLDEMNLHSPYNFLIPFLRFRNHEIVDSFVYNYLSDITNYAAKKNVQLVPDLDIRNARQAFRKNFPNDLQEMVRIKEVEFNSGKQVAVSIPSMDLSDHYSGGNNIHHIPLKGKVIGIFAYNKDKNGLIISAEDIKDITKLAQIVYVDKDTIKIKVNKAKEYKYASVIVSFSHLYPDIFSPRTLEFQRNILEQYKDLPFIGVCKDEWGFPPYFPRNYREGFHDFWFSKNRAEKYKEITKGRDLIQDFLLMVYGINGKEDERISAINTFVKMSRDRNTELEDDFYDAVKEYFGSDAIVSVHSTWWPFPDKNEFKKNGLDWWSTKRDWGQTDEVIPFAVRTALAKKWGSPLWYNMYYKADLGQQMWSSALGGGRIDYLPYTSLLTPELMIAEKRIRLLNYISEAPLDCRIAVVFGHSAASNWAGRYFDDVGMSLVDSLWHSGYPTDLIPTSEIYNGSLKIGEDGSIQYGNQQYDVVVLYHPEYEDEALGKFFVDASRGNTSLISIGEWTRNFSGQMINSNQLLPDNMSNYGSISDGLPRIKDILVNKDVRKQTDATFLLDNTFFKLRDFNHQSFAFPTAGMSRMNDGTVIQVAGMNNVAGDTIINHFDLGDGNAFVDAIGTVGARVDKNGRLEALAASGLKSFKFEDFVIELEDRTDVVLLKEGGKWKGVVQDLDGAVPESLMSITTDWERIRMPAPPED